MKVNKKGEGKAGCLIFLVLFVFVIAVLYKAGPTYMNAMQFQNDLEEVTNKAGAFFWSKRRIENKIIELAKENNQPVTKRNIRINMYRNNITVEVDYIIPLDLVVTTYNYHIHKKYKALRGGF